MRSDWLPANRALPLDDDAALGRLCEQIRITFSREHGRQRVFLNGTDVTDAIRLPEVSMLASAVSAQPSVRKALVAQQRACAGDGLVADGRDAGTVIFPERPSSFTLMHPWKYAPKDAIKNLLIKISR